jgi:hydrogenase-4 component B
MIKTGIYAIVRVFFEFARLPGLTTIWGGVIAFLGGLSILMGTLTALRDDDAKRVLSFHSIGQIGYMLLGIGTGLFFLGTNSFLAAIGLIAGIYHTINHACYKSLLFLNVGAAEYYTGTRDLNKMGGLGAAMPLTLAASIVASLSIAGIPPFNGFVSKWLIYHSTIRAGFTAPAFLVLGVLAMFISLVTLASFMKLLGAVFLGKRAAGLEQIDRDVPTAMVIPQMTLAAACVALGVAPIPVLAVLYGVAHDTIGHSVPAFAGLFGTDPTGISLRFGKGLAGVWNPCYFVVALVLCAALSVIISRLGRARARQTVGWYCGEEAAPDDIRYRAHGFCLPFKEAFNVPYPRIRLPKAWAMRWLQGVLDLDRWAYNPLVGFFGRETDRLSKTHSGVPQMYMLWQVIGIIVVFGVLLAWLH